MQYKIGKYKYFDFLVKINNYYLKWDILGLNVREEDEDNLKLYDNLLESFFDNISMAKTIDEIISYALNLTGFLCLRQPFYDGNSRTLKTFLALLFKQLNYRINFLDIDSQLIIPIFYYDEDTCTQNNINDFKKLLIKIK